MGKAEPLLAWCDAKDCSQSSMDITEMLAKNGAKHGRRELKNSSWFIGITLGLPWDYSGSMGFKIFRDAALMLERSKEHVPADSSWRRELSSCFCFCHVWFGWFNLNLTSRVTHPVAQVPSWPTQQMTWKCRGMGSLGSPLAWKLRTYPDYPSIWVCLKMGYTPNYSHLVGIMIIYHWV